MNVGDPHTSASSRSDANFGGFVHWSSLLDQRKLAIDSLSFLSRMCHCVSGTAIIFSVICGWFQSYINEETAVQDMHLLTILENGVFTASTLFVFLTDPTKRSHLERELAKWFRSFLNCKVAEPVLSTSIRIHQYLNCPNIAMRILLPRCGSSVELMTILRDTSRISCQRI